MLWNYGMRKLASIEERSRADQARGDFRKTPKTKYAAANGQIAMAQMSMEASPGCSRPNHSSGKPRRNIRAKEPNAPNVPSC